MLRSSPLLSKSSKFREWLSQVLAACHIHVVPFSNEDALAPVRALNERQETRRGVRRAVTRRPLQS